MSADWMSDFWSYTEHWIWIPILKVEWETDTGIECWLWGYNEKWIGMPNLLLNYFKDLSILKVDLESHTVTSINWYRWYLKVRWPS